MATSTSSDTEDIFLNKEDTKLLVQEEARAIAQRELRNASRELRSEVKDIRKEFMTVFGLFAAFLTFTVLQIQSFIQAKNMALTIGAAAFFVATSLTFVLALHNMVHEKNDFKELRRPLFWIIIMVYFFSFECFWYSTHHGELWLFVSTAVGTHSSVSMFSLAGITLNALATLVLFKFGFPQPNHDEEVSIGLEGSTILPGGLTINQENSSIKKRKKLYKIMSLAGLGLMFLGFAFQLIGMF